MFIDWLSMVMEVQTAEDRELVRRLGQGRDVCVKIRDGEPVVEWYPRESKRSDSHTLQVGLTANRITLDGSPARLYADNNVFGDSDARASALKMIRSASKSSGVILPSLDRWRCTRLDLTQNYALENIGQVRSALGELSKVAGGHLKVSTFKETPYWNRFSPLWSAKAYAKGPQLAQHVKEGKSTATDRQLVDANRLLRLEVTIKNRLIRAGHLNWESMTPERLVVLFLEIAEKIIPPNVGDISSEAQLCEAAIAKFGTRKGRALYAFWSVVKAQGVEATQETFSRTMWFYRTRDLRALGVSLSDLNSGQILAFRPKAIVARPVDSWDDLRRAA